MSHAFRKVPILDWKLIETGHKADFISQLRDALVTCGFLYLQHPPVDPELTRRVKEYAPKLFELPSEKKLALRMSNSPHFLGYSSLGSELTKGTVDQREQFDFGTQVECKWKPGDLDYLKLWGPPQWPAEDDIPGFRSTFSAYLSQVEALSEELTELISEALGLGPHALDVFFDNPKRAMQHRSKIVKYPLRDGKDQGVGPHYDSGFLTLLLQASDHRGLQAQDPLGEWIDVPPIDDTLVINVGKGLEMVTQHVAVATSHRVISPVAGVQSSPRYSIPFFQTIRQDIKLPDFVLRVPSDVLALRDARGSIGKSESVNYSEYDREPTGKVALIGRVKSHPDVAERHYPNLFKLYFPDAA
ncbi:hypothetical protein M408DRAFT_64609 [Serendipita vermifera MAFF 305830]|uniref:Fe2OG dioxygenase domain-containing protein n=1 Tax=Serendipita vermifera MAFF 305830 TaxID=933852 RepID=A0A0C3B2Y8_SERVB|nr:hypothetical protein M408DRAFT_64609 [Serendipita vermifera MAFF 305830]